MNIYSKTIILIVAAASAIGLGGCSMFHKHQPKSTFKIIEEGDDNPYIIDNPTRAGTQMRTVEVRRY